LPPLPSLGAFDTIILIITFYPSIHTPNHHHPIVFNYPRPHHHLDQDISLASLPSCSSPTTITFFASINTYHNAPS